MAILKPYEDYQTWEMCQKFYFESLAETFCGDLRRHLDYEEVSECLRSSFWSDNGEVFGAFTKPLAGICVGWERPSTERCLVPRIGCNGSFHNISASKHRFWNYFFSIASLFFETSSVV